MQLKTSEPGRRWYRRPRGGGLTGRPRPPPRPRRPAAPPVAGRIGIRSAARGSLARALRCAAPIRARMRRVARAPELAVEARSLVSGGYLAAMDSNAVVAYRESGALHAFALAWSPEEYRRRGPSADDYCTDVTAVKMWHADVSAAAVGAVCGPIAVDTSGLKRGILPLAMVTLEGMLGLLQREHARHCRDTVDVLATDMVALTARPTSLDEFAGFLEVAVPHFEGGEMRVGAAAALATATAFDELLASDPLAGMSSGSESAVSSSERVVWVR